MNHPCQSPYPGQMKFHWNIRIQVFNIMNELNSQDIELYGIDYEADLVVYRIDTAILVPMIV